MGRWEKSHGTSHPNPKKNEDLEMSGMNEKEFGERGSFLPKSAPRYRARVDGGIGNVLSRLENTPGAALLTHCFSSISMTVVNKYVVSGSSWNLNFLYLAVQLCAPRHSGTPHQDYIADSYSIGCSLRGCNFGLEANGFYH